MGYAFGQHGIRLISARISTIGEQVEDIFFITDRQGRMLSETLQRQVEQGILERLAGR